MGMHWKLKISEYGKIKSAEIEAAPFTLFVGDNNSGKSYLMSLLWGIQNLGAEALIYHRAEADRNEAAVLMKWIKKQIAEAWKQGSHVAQVREVGEELQTVLQESLNQNKDKFVGRIFNSEDVKLRDLRIELTDLENICLKISKSQAMNDERTGFLTIRGGLGSGFRMEFSESRLQMMDGELEWALMAAFYAQIMEIPFGDMSRVGRDIYLPAARTGKPMIRMRDEWNGRCFELNFGKGMPFLHVPVQMIRDGKGILIGEMKRENFAHVNKTSQ